MNGYEQIQTKYARFSERLFVSRDFARCQNKPQRAQTNAPADDLYH
jgi:hypothetical protein